MRRFWILFTTELKAWRYDPITALGGVLPPLFILLAFGLMLGGRVSFRVVIINDDDGPAGAVLRETFDEVISPLDNHPYYDVQDLPAAEAWAAYEAHRVDALWLIPSDFSQRLAAGAGPQLELYFSNYNDDRAKNHRIYAAEILWRFYEKIGQPGPPLQLAEEYPRSEMVGWLPIIAVGVVLLSATLGGIFNVFALTFKEKTTQVTLEFGLAPRSLAWVLLPKILLAAIAALMTSGLFLLLVRLWLGYGPGAYLAATWLLAGLTALFWIGTAVLFGLYVRDYMSGAIAAVLGALLIFFVGGGWFQVRYNEEYLLRFAWLFPNTHAVDPLRDLILFHTWPSDWTITWVKLLLFAAAGLFVGCALGTRRLRRLG